MENVLVIDVFVQPPRLSKCFYIAFCMILVSGPAHQRRRGTRGGAFMSVLIMADPTILKGTHLIDKMIFLSVQMTLHYSVTQG